MKLPTSAPFRPLFALTALIFAVQLTACEAPGGAADGDPAALPSATLFEGARIITGTDAPPIEDGAFVVEDGRFTSVGRRGDVAVPDDALRVDLSGRTVMPALVNTHMHLPITREERIEALQHSAYYGQALVMSLGHDSGDVPLDMRQESLPGAARSMSAGPGITRPEPGRSEIPYWIDTVEEGREAVREMAAQGVDMVKIWVDDRNGQYEKLTPELWEPIIEEAHRHDLRVAAHIFSLEDAKGLVRAGVDVFAHGVRDRDVDDEFVDLARGNPDLYYVPNLPDPGTARELSWLVGTIPEAELSRLQEGARDGSPPSQGFLIQARNLTRLHQAGVPIAFGTDGGSPWAAHLELEDMVLTGMTPGEAVVAATRTSAELLGAADLGTIEAGKSAAFLVLDANPLDDITHTRRISAVYLDGQPLDRAGFSARMLGRPDG